MPTFETQLAAAAQYQLESVKDSLVKENIFLSEDDIRLRLIISMHSRLLTKSIVEQITRCPKELAEMSIAEKISAAKWARPPGPAGTKETGRATLDELISQSGSR